MEVKSEHDQDEGLLERRKEGVKHIFWNKYASGPTLGVKSFRARPLGLAIPEIGVFWEECSVRRLGLLRRESKAKHRCPRRLQRCLTSEEGTVGGRRGLAAE